MNISIKEIIVGSAFILLLYLFCAGVFSQDKVTDGIDEKGQVYVLRIIGDMYPKDKDEATTTLEAVTKYGTLIDARKGDILQYTDRDTGNEVIHFDVVCKDKTNTEDFFTAITSLNVKMKISKHKCYNKDQSGGNNAPCIEEGTDTVIKG